MTDHSALIERLDAAVTAMKRRADDGWKMMPSVPSDDMTEALESCESYCDSCHGTAFSGWAGYDAMFKAAPDAILMLDVLAEAAAALRDLTELLAGFVQDEDDARSNPLGGVSLGGLMDCRDNSGCVYQSAGLAARIAKARVLTLPYAPNQAKEAGE